MISVGETRHAERRRRNFLMSLIQEGKLSGKSTAERRNSGEFLENENTKGEA
jgi:hypothetical protein